ncbi:MAG: hypothetical protein V4730_07000 [Pseudomonadota bacterium]
MPRICNSSTLRQTGAMVLALMFGGAVLPAQAISVNDMVVWSASSKPLRMDIELVDLQSVRLSDISLAVASAAEHERVGLIRPEWAESVSFKVIALDSGKVIARASSAKSVDADFVSFLVSIRGAGIGQLQQVASKVSADGAEPLASPQAEPVAPRAEKAPVATAFADKPVAKPALIESRPAAAAQAPVVKPAPAPKPVVVQKPVVAVKPTPAPKPVAVVAPAPVAALEPSPAPAALVAAAEIDNAVVLADVGAEPTLESLQAERAQLLQQVTDLQARLIELDQQIAALNPEAMPATETPTALAEAETSPAEPVEGKLLGYTYFSNILLGLLALFMSGMILLDRMRSRLR